MDVLDTVFTSDEDAAAFAAAHDMDSESEEEAGGEAGAALQLGNVDLGREGAQAAAPAEPLMAAGGELIEVRWPPWSGPLRGLSSAACAASALHPGSSLSTSRGAVALRSPAAAAHLPVLLQAQAAPGWPRAAAL